MELSKNYRFRTGTKVDILHSPVWEGHTLSIADTTSGGIFEVVATLDRSLAGEQVVVNDICAFGFGVGVIKEINSNSIRVQFPNSMFPPGGIAKYVGNAVQHTLIFSMTGRTEPGFAVAQYKEEVEQATFGYAKSVYNLQTNAELTLTPVSLVDDGLLSKIMYSKGYVLKSCNDENYTPSNTWNQDFPIELSGTSIDPIYRRAFLLKREFTAKGMRSRLRLAFKLIG